MKVIGRQLLAASDVSPLAKKRLALWVKQLAESSWVSVEEFKTSYPDAMELGRSRVEIAFLSLDLKVVVLTNLDLGIICIEKVTEQKARKG